MNSIPRLETERYKLRAIFPADAQGVFRLFSDPNVTRHYDFETFENLQQAQEFIAKFAHWFQTDHAVRWGIFDKESEELIGSCCLDTFHKGYHTCNIGYNVRSDLWGKGIATEVAAKVISFGFENGIVGPLNRIQAITVPENQASERVLAKLGFEHEGLMREFGYWKGSYRDMNRFGLINPKKT